MGLFPAMCPNNNLIALKLCGMRIRHNTMTFGESILVGEMYISFEEKATLFCFLKKSIFDHLVGSRVWLPVSSQFSVFNLFVQV